MNPSAKTDLRLSVTELPNESAESPFSSGITLAIAGTFLFALKSIFIKLAYAAGGEATVLLLMRLVFALPFYVAVFLQGRSSLSSKPLCKTHVVQSLLLGFLGYYLASYLDLKGLQFITAQLERLTLFIYPAIVAVLAWMFLGESLTRRIIVAILLCYCGIAVMYSQEIAMIGGANVPLGVALVGGSAISYSVYTLFAKSTMLQIGSRMFTSLAMIGSTLFVMVHFAISHDVAELWSLQPIVYVYGFILAIVCTLVPSFMINEAIMKIGATRTAVIGSAGPVLTMMLAIFVLGEPSSAGHFAGMLIAIIGVSLVSRKS